MATRRAFVIWLIFMGVSFHETKSALPLLNRQFAEQCQRIINEIDENSIARAKSGCHLQRLSDYERDRQELLNYEMNSSFASDVKLTENEQLANQIILHAKETEYEIGMKTPYRFYPSRHIFEVLDDIKNSKLFQIIQKMPKGGILHAHDTALCSTDYLVSLTYWPELWQQTVGNSTNIMEFRFSKEQPTSLNDQSRWRRVKDVRNEIGAAKYDADIRKRFTLFDRTVNPRTQFKDINDVWDHFMGIFILISPIVTYAPVWKAYYKNALQEVQNDNVQYLEFRGILPPVCLIKYCWTLM